MDLHFSSYPGSTQPRLERAKQRRNLQSTSLMASSSQVLVDVYDSHLDENSVRRALGPRESADHELK